MPAEETSSNRPRISLSGMVVLVGVLGLLIYEPPLRSLRPDAPDPSPMHDALAQQIVEARLWQDPLRPVQDYHAGEQGKATGAFELARGLPSLALHVRDQVRTGERVGIVVAMVQGGPYAEQAERRRRDRYAILTGFANRHYLPLTSDHIGYIETRWSPSYRLLRNLPGAQPLLIPFEWLIFLPANDSDAQALKDGNLDRVLLLWVDEGRVTSEPYRFVDSLLSHLVGYLTDSQRETAVEFDLIGPATSEGLRAMYREAERLRLPVAPAVYQSAYRAPETPALLPNGRPTPQAQQLEAVAAGAAGVPARQVALDGLQQELDSYLDEGLFGQADASALQGFDTAVSEELKQTAQLPLIERKARLGDAIKKALPDITDSDSQWATNVAGYWLMNQAVADLPATGPDPRAADVLLLVADNYLDNGLPANANQQLAAFRKLHEAAHGKGEGHVLDALAGGLATVFEGIRDSDESWESSTAALWWRVYGEAEEGLPPGHGTGALKTTTGLPPADENAVVASSDKDLIDALAASMLVQANAAADVGSEPLAALLLQVYERMSSGDSNPAKPELREQLAIAATGATASKFMQQGRTLSFESAVAAVDRWFVANFELIHGISNWGEQPGASVLQRVDVYSSRATVNPEYLQREKKARDFWDTIGTPVRSFNRTIAHDGMLVEQLKEELYGPRGLERCKDAVILVGEWDTYYSRHLAEEFANGSEPEPGSDCGDDRDSVILVNYLRGLDGALPGEKNRSGDSSATNPTGGVRTSAAAARDPNESQERASGRMQIDYFRRLAADIHDFVPRDMEVGAIGIIGSDIYDKLVVLQALRARFPGALFFTTDMDARFLHPAVYPYTRNLLVASHYGLTLAPKHQRPFPPFRDGYQSATYLAARWVLGGEQPVAFLPSADYAVPRLFEIARYRARDLSPAAATVAEREPGRIAGATTVSEASDFAAEWVLVHPSARTSHTTFLRFLGANVWKLGYAVLLMVVATALLAPSVSPLRSFLLEHSAIERADRFAAYAIVVLSIVLLGTVARGVWSDSMSAIGEPLSLLDGVSTWPTELLRAAATVLSFAFIFVGMSSIRKSNRDLHGDCCLRDAGADRAEDSADEQDGSAAVAKEGRAIVGLVTQWRKRVCIVDWEVPQRSPFEKEQEKSAAEIWTEYVARGTWGKRWTRVGLMATAYLGLAALVVLLLGSSDAPVRGDNARLLDRRFFALSFVALTLLVFFVVDATRLCRRMIGIMSSCRTAWPAELCAKLGLQRQLDPADVADYMDIRFIGERTAVIAPLVVYPFVVLFMLLLARNSYFDNWAWPAALVVALGVLSVFAIASALGLRWSAEDVRKRAMQRLRRRISRVLAEDRTDKGDYVQRLELLVEEVRSIEQGAFAPWSRHPVMQAVLIPFGGIGAVALIDILATLGL